MSLLVLVVTLNSCSRDFVDPRLLNFHLRLAEMNVEVFAHVIWIFRFFKSDLSVQPMAVVQLMVMRGSYPRILHLIPHQYLEYPSVEFVAPVALVHEDTFAHAIQTVPLRLFLW